MNSSYISYASHSTLFLSNVALSSKKNEIENQKYKTQKREDSIAGSASASLVREGEKRFRDYCFHMENSYPFKLEGFGANYAERAKSVVAELVVGPKDWPTVGPALVEEFSKFVWVFSCVSLLYVFRLGHETRDKNVSWYGTPAFWQNRDRCSGRIVSAIDRATYQDRHHCYS